MSGGLSPLSFPKNARAALANPPLLKAIAHIEETLVNGRRRATEALPEFDALRDAGRDIKAHTLKHLDLYLEAFERKVLEAGGVVHWAVDAADAALREAAEDVLFDSGRPVLLVPPHGGAASPTG